jgi:hypothetical protein
MATFEKRGKFWRVKVRRGGAPAQTRTFDSKSQQSARTAEGEIDNRVLVDRWAADRTSLAQVLKRYRCEVTPLSVVLQTRTRVVLRRANHRIPARSGTRCSGQGSVPTTRVLGSQLLLLA